MKFDLPESVTGLHTGLHNQCITSSLCAFRICRRSSLGSSYQVNSSGLRGKVTRGAFRPDKVI